MTILNTLEKKFFLSMFRIIMKKLILQSLYRFLMQSIPSLSKVPGRKNIGYQFHRANPRRNGLRSIQKAQPVGWAFLIPLRHSSFSPQNFAMQTFAGAPPYGLRKGVGVNFITQTHVKSYILRNQSVAFFLCFHIVKIPPCYTSGMEEFL